MSKQGCFLLDAVNNSAVRSSRRVVTCVLGTKKAQPVVILEHKYIPTTTFDRCQVCKSTVTAVWNKVIGYTFSVKCVDKGLYLLGACGGTHFVPYHRVVADDGVAMGAESWSGDVKSDRDTGNGGGAIGIAVDRGRFVQGQAQCVDRFAVDNSGVGDSCSGSRFVSSQSPISVSASEGRTVVDCGGSTGGVVSDSVNTRLLHHQEGVGHALGKDKPIKGLRAMRRFFSGLQRPSKEQRKKGISNVYRKEWNSIGDVWCRNCGNSEERCLNCDLLVEAQVAEAAVRTARARTSLELENNLNEGVARRADNVKDNRHKTGGLGNESARKTLVVDTNTSESVGRFPYETKTVVANDKKKKEAVVSRNVRRNFPAVGSDEWVQECQKFEQCKEYIATLVPAKRSALFVEEDKQYLVSCDTKTMTDGFASMRRRDQLDIAYTLSLQDLQYLAKAKSERQ